MASNYALICGRLYKLPPKRKPPSIDQLMDKFLKAADEDEWPSHENREIERPDEFMIELVSAQGGEETILYRYRAKNGKPADATDKWRFQTTVDKNVVKANITTTRSSMKLHYRRDPREKIRLKAELQWVDLTKAETHWVVTEFEGELEDFLTVHEFLQPKKG